MNPAWAFFILTVFVLACTVALAWAGTIRRKRLYEEFLLRKAERRAKSCN